MKSSHGLTFSFCLSSSFCALYTFLFICGKCTVDICSWFVLGEQIREVGYLHESLHQGPASALLGRNMDLHSQMRSDTCRHLTGPRAYPWRRGTHPLSSQSCKFLTKHEADCCVLSWVTSLFKQILWAVLCLYFTVSHCPGFALKNSFLLK